MLEQMFGDGLNPTLVDALQEVSYHIPRLLPLIEMRVVSEIGLILGGVPYEAPVSLLGEINDTGFLLFIFLFSLILCREHRIPLLK